MEQFSRIVRMLDQEWLDKLQTKKVAVFGLDVYKRQNHNCFGIDCSFVPNIFVNLFT